MDAKQGINLGKILAAARRRGQAWARSVYRHQLAAGILRVGMMFQAAPAVAHIHANGRDAQGDQEVVDLMALATIAAAAGEWAKMHADLLREQRGSGPGRKQWQVLLLTKPAHRRRRDHQQPLGTVEAHTLAGALWAARLKWPANGASCPGYPEGALRVKPVRAN